MTDEQIKQMKLANHILMTALTEIANQATAATNGLSCYEGDTYGYILKVAKQAMLKGGVLMDVAELERSL